MERRSDTQDLAIQNKAQVYYGGVVHAVTIASCLIALLTPVLILLFPGANLLNPNLIFGAIFEGQSPAEIWLGAGVPLEQGSFWGLFWDNLFTPDGFAMFGIVLGCSSALWALIPTVWSYVKEKSWFYLGISVSIMLLIIFAMTGLVSVA